MKTRLSLAIFLSLLHLCAWSQIGGDFNPENPSDPGTPVLKYTLSLNASPKEGGSFNFVNERMSVGSNNSLRAYANTDFVFKYWQLGDSVLSTSSSINFVMPAHDVQLTGVFEYNPANPWNPNRNYWNKQTGEVIVDNFTPGNLLGAIFTVIGGSSSNDVQMITVSGKINSNDFGIVNHYTNCTLLDLSRVTGIFEIPSYAFDNTNLESVYLPATIEKIGGNAFAGCASLSAVTIYAMTPPVLESNVFQGVHEGLVVYVPAGALSAYQNDVTWGNFILLPIQEDIRSISVSLPHGTNVKDYKGMWLELTNTKSGQRMHYVMTDRMLYTFANIIRNTSWNVIIRNERGDIFGRIDNVEVKDDDVNVSLSGLLEPQNVTLNVLTPDGRDVKDMIVATWTDAEGNYLAQGTALHGLPTGYETQCRIMLPQELAMSYNTPELIDYVIADGNNIITCQLNAIPLVKISGKVKDASTGIPLNDATVSASQTFAGKYSRTLNTKTDNNGAFSFEVPNVSTSVSVVAPEYISKSVNCDSLLVGADTVNLSDISLNTITGATVSIDFTYTTCDGESQNWYSDYKNVDYMLFNITKNKEIGQYNVQYPQIVLLEEVADGDQLRLTASSRVNAFMPVEDTVTFDGQKAKVTFGIVELGKIQAKFTSTGNASVVGSLYDSNGKLLKTYEYSETTLDISDLVDGNYTLVSMGNSRFFNTIYDLAQFPQTGLKEGADYVKNSIEVKSGTVSNVNIGEIPEFDDTRFYFTDTDKTSFTVNKSEIVAGNYLTFTGRIGFKPAYTADISNLQLIVDLPETCEFVENSAMVGNTTGSYIINGHRIVIPVAKYSERVRFCVTPTLGGEYAPSAFAQFDLDGKTITQPIGSANYSVKDLTISVPSTVAKTTIPVSGTAIGVSHVEIYDNDVLIGETTSKANGIWVATCELNDAYNLSRHQLYAKVTTKQGLELVTDNVSCVYDMNAIQVSVVKMYHDNPELHKTYELTFDFLNPSDKEENYIYYIYNKKFTFTIDFTNNAPDKVSDVILYVKTAKSGWHPLEAAYDAKQDLWVAAGEFGNMYDGDLPVNVSVDYSVSSLVQIDYDKLNEPLELHESIQQEFIEENNLIESVFSSNDQVAIDSYMANSGYSDEYWLQFVDEKSLSTLLDTMTDAEKEVYVAQFFSGQEGDETIYGKLENLKANFDYDENWNEINVGGALYRRSVCYDTDSVSLVADGFESYICDNNSIVFFKSTEEGYEWIDTNKHIKYSCIYSNTSEMQLIRKANRDTFTAEDLRQWTKSIYEKVSFVNGVFGRLELSLDDALVPFVAEQARLGRQKGVLTILKRKCNPALLHIYNQQIQEIDKKLALLRNGIKSIRKLTKAVKKYMPVVKYSLIASDAVIDLNKLHNIYISIPEQCEEDENKAAEYKADIAQKAGFIFSYYMFYLGFDTAASVTNVTQAAAGFATGGSSIVTAIVGELMKIGIEFLADTAKDVSLSRYIRDMNEKIDNLECNKLPCPGGKCQISNDDMYFGHPSNNPDKKFGIDPSGYVYEGIQSNRLEGVTATAYYKETVEDMYGDLHENVVKWNAEEYAQENPLFTDENGFYRWDVPQGLWQVKFEKDGYETTYSDWLPVPPPQLDVNIAMKQNRQPEVKMARAYENAVEVEFDKYMMPEFLTEDNVAVLQNGKQVEGTVELLNEEKATEGSNLSFASKVRFNAATPFAEKEVTLMVSNRVKSYAGIRMQDNYQQTFATEQEIRQIVCDSLRIVRYGESTNLVVQVLPASASKGKLLNIKSSSPIIISVDREHVTIGDDGRAEFFVTGELPGTAALTFSIENTDKSAVTIARVEKRGNNPVAAPQANIASGTVVAKGTEVALSCETDGAVIFYTLDGSCPCDNTDARHLYDGTPIVIDRTTTIKAIVIAPDMSESEVVEFTYIVNVGGFDNVVMDTSIEVFPLPVHEILNVTAGGKVIKNVILTAINGMNVAVSKVPATMVTLDVNKIPAGIYILKVSTEDGAFTRKIQKVQ